MFSDLSNSYRIWRKTHLKTFKYSCKKKKRKHPSSKDKSSIRVEKLFNGVLSEEENRYLFYSNFNSNSKSSSIT